MAVCEAIEENKPLIERMITISGEGVASPQNIYTKVGVTFRDLIERVGGYVDEDSQGIPFVGKAGQLMNKAFVGIGINRENVYIFSDFDKTYKAKAKIIK